MPVVLPSFQGKESIGRPESSAFMHEVVQLSACTKNSCSAADGIPRLFDKVPAGKYDDKSKEFIRQHQQSPAPIISLRCTVATEMRAYLVYSMDALDTCDVGRHIKLYILRWVTAGDIKSLNNLWNSLHVDPTPGLDPVGTNRAQTGRADVFRCIWLEIMVVQDPVGVATSRYMIRAAWRQGTTCGRSTQLAICTGTKREPKPVEWTRSAAFGWRRWWRRIRSSWQIFLNGLTGRTTPHMELIYDADGFAINPDTIMWRDAQAIFSAATELVALRIELVECQDIPITGNRALPALQNVVELHINPFNTASVRFIAALQVPAVTNLHIKAYSDLDVYQLIISDISAMKSATHLNLQISCTKNDTIRSVIGRATNIISLDVRDNDDDVFMMLVNTITGPLPRGANPSHICPKMETLIADPSAGIFWVESAIMERDAAFFHPNMTIYFPEISQRRWPATEYYNEDGECCSRRVTREHAHITQHLEH
ncbi:hypothetical protein FB451DRAFT_1173126 [Mycena latifolia]|nr:hypothetical protein FB451DRAFT_1173126 [Mycena latifolia]